MTGPRAADRAPPERPPAGSIQVVVAYDFSPVAEEALRQAIELAARIPGHVLNVVTAIHPTTGLAISPTSHVTRDYVDRIERLVAARIADMVAGRPHAGDVRFAVHAAIGAAADEILRVARLVDAGLVFIGSHGKTSAERVLLGSVSARVCHEARCTVVVARAHP